MNRQTPPPFMPVPPLSGDSIQIQAFAMAGERNFLHLNSTLGISLETDQYRRLQQHFFKTEARNPTMGELRLLGHIYPRFPLARRAAPGEIYTNSTVIMDTWADAMEGFRALCNNPEQLCTLSELLSLPEAYRARTGRLNLPQKFRVSADEGGLEALSQGFRPIATVTPNGGAPRNIWVKAPESDTSFRDAAPKAGDILLAIPPTRWEALCAFLYEHPLASAIKAVTAVKNTSLLVAALSLCQGRGLTVNLNTLVSPSAHPESSLIKQYLDTWEADAPAGTAYAVLLLPPAMQALLFTALSEHGFSPKLLGTVTKKPYLIFSDGATTPVHLKSDILLDTPRQSFRYVLSEPKPICGSLPQYMTLSRMITVPDTDCTVLDATLQVSGDEGFTPAVQGILSLCFAYAAAGITYDQVAISPVLYMTGTEKSPLLLSAVCGLYRAATELAIPLTAPEILFKPAAEGEPHTLVLSLTAYTSATPRECSDSLVAPELPLCLMSLDADPRWEDIRGLLFTTARAVLHNAQTTAHPLLGESVTSHLSRMAAINPTLQANLFDTHRELLSASLPFAMIAVGDILPGGLHIGNTGAAAEGKAPPSCEPPMLSPSITPYPTVILQEMKDKETKRRNVKFRCMITSVILIELTTQFFFYVVKRKDDVKWQYLK